MVAEVDRLSLFGSAVEFKLPCNTFSIARHRAETLLFQYTCWDCRVLFPCIGYARAVRILRLLTVVLALRWIVHINGCHFLIGPAGYALSLPQSVLCLGNCSLVCSSNATGLTNDSEIPSFIALFFPSVCGCVEAVHYRYPLSVIVSIQPL